MSRIDNNYFTYRQTPTNENGTGTLESIRGQSLVWNQLSKTNTEVRTANGMTQQVVNGLLTIGGTPTTSFIQVRMSFGTDTVPQGHKVLLKGRSANFYFRIQGNTSVTTVNDSVIFTTGSGIYSDVVLVGAGLDTTATYNESFYPQIFDLTQMFGSGNEPTTVDQFVSYFPLNYYPYTQGELISFNGNGIKTVGFNLFDQDSVLTNVGFVKQSDGSFYIQYPSNAQYRVLFENKLKYSGQFFLTYKYKYANTTSQGCRFEVHYTDGAVDQIYATGSNDFVEVSFISRANKVLDYINATYGSNIGTWWKDVCINISDPSKNGTYEPYASSTTSLPISTYFPNGMDGVGTDYDELTNTKATTRMARVDLGSLNWAYASGVQRFYALNFANVKTNAENVLANICCALYENSMWSQVQGDATKDKVISVANKNILIRDKTYTDPMVFKNSLNGIYLVYPLATPTETSFTTASLVTENAEIPLSNNDGVLIGKCIEELSAEPGFHDAKIKLADADGECYSNKLQLHVERSPQ